VQVGAQDPRADRDTETGNQFGAFHKLAVDGSVQQCPQTVDQYGTLLRGQRMGGLDRSTALAIVAFAAVAQCGDARFR
jgi:hypothetical protein